MEGLVAEYNQVKKHDFKLDFIYPTTDQRKYLNIINRDMSEAEKSKVKKNKDNIATLISDLVSGQIYFEDLGTDQIEKLRELINKQEG
jgi:superfamily I DNA and RNA helicase